MTANVYYNDIELEVRLCELKHDLRIKLQNACAFIINSMDEEVRNGVVEDMFPCEDKIKQIICNHVYNSMERFIPYEGQCYVIEHRKE